MQGMTCGESEVAPLGNDHQKLIMSAKLPVEWVPLPSLCPEFHRLSFMDQAIAVFVEHIRWTR